MSLTPPPRQSWRDTIKPVRLLLVFGPWAIFTLWNAFGIVSNIDAKPNFFSGPTVPLIFSFWGLMAALALPALIFNLIPLTNFKRMVFGAICVDLMLGRIAAGLTMAAALGGAESFRVFLLTPFLFFVFGLGAIVALFFVVMTVVGVFVIAPMLMFVTISHFDSEMRKARHHTSGLSAKLAGLMDWVANSTREALPDDEKGARFATIQEIRNVHKPQDQRSIGFGYINDQPLMLHTEKHVLVMALDALQQGCRPHCPAPAALPGQRLRPRSEGRERQSYGGRGACA